MAAFLVASTQLTLFVVPPIGAVPDGQTVVLKRVGSMQFIDSPDAMCERIQGGVSLLCRGMAIGTAIDGGDAILARLPYSATLYGISTGGKSYER